MSRIARNFKVLFCRRSSFALVLACLAVAGCGGFGSNRGSSSSTEVSGAAPLDVMRPGDKITVRLSGVPDEGYFNEIQIPDSGDISVPLLSHTFHATGRTTADLSADISAEYKAQKIYSNPNVTVISEQRFVNVGGDVRSPSRVLYTSDLTLLSAINSCGGFTEYANRRTVRIIRGQKVIVINAVVAAGSPGSDPAVYPGDQIYVPRTMF